MEERLQSITEMRQFNTPVQSSSSGVTTTAVPRLSSKGNAKVIILYLQGLEMDYTQ